MEDLRNLLNLLKIGGSNKASLANFTIRGKFKLVNTWEVPTRCQAEIWG